MKSHFRLSHPWDKIFGIFLITLHFHHGLGRPSRDYVDTRIIIQNVNVSDGEDAYAYHHPQVRGSHQDLRHTDDTHHLKMEDRSRPVKDYDTPLLYSQRDLIDFLSTSSDDVNIFKVGNDDMSTQDDANLYVVPDKERLVVRHKERPFTARNLVRKRRQPETHRPHRRRRRKHHRLVLKARDDNRNYLSDGKDDFKDRHIIKSDSPGFVITSASEVKKDWCKTIPLKHRVTELNCRSRVVQNNFCYGQCNSFFIPHTSRTDDKVAFQSCAVCKPVRQHWGNVTLNCPGNNPPKVVKTVLFVDACRCVSEVLQ